MLIKYIGITINKNLQWTNHIIMLTNIKINSIPWILYMKAFSMSECCTFIAFEYIYSEIMKSTFPINTIADNSIKKLIRSFYQEGRKQINQKSSTKICNILFLFVKANKNYKKYSKLCRNHI